jgi:adenosylcobinamide-GDP ribazoletransferase
MRDALAFLTVLPAGSRVHEPRRAALLMFPFAGAVVGLAWAAAAWAGLELWGVLPAASAVLAVDLLITGGLHLDAIADVADGFASRRTGDEAVRVMRDPAVGAVGAAGLIAVMLLRFSLLAALVSPAGLLALVTVPVAGRVAMLWMLMRATPRGPSLASSLSQAAGVPVCLAAATLALALAWSVAGLPGMGAVMMALGVSEACIRLFRRRVGFLTGDAVGSAGMMAELATLGLLAAV